jgi:hypothetical protein
MVDASSGGDPEQGVEVGARERVLGEDGDGASPLTIVVPDLLAVRREEHDPGCRAPARQSLGDGEAVVAEEIDGKSTGIRAAGGSSRSAC